MDAENEGRRCASNGVFIIGSGRRRSSASLAAVITAGSASLLWEEKWSARIAWRRRVRRGPSASGALDCWPKRLAAFWGAVAFAGKLMISILDRFHDASMWEKIVE